MAMFRRRIAFIKASISCSQAASFRSTPRRRTPDRSYWSAADVAAKGLESQITGTDSEVTEELHKILLSAVRLRMIADVPLGAFLSGGLIPAPWWH